MGRMACTEPQCLYKGAISCGPLKKREQQSQYFRAWLLEHNRDTDKISASQLFSAYVSCSYVYRFIKLCLKANLCVSNRMSNVTHDGTSQFIEVLYSLEPNTSSTNVSSLPPPLPPSSSVMQCSLSVLYDHATRFDITVPSTDRRANKKVTFTLHQAMKDQTDQ
jgi:hypothetical protein